MGFKSLCVINEDRIEGGTGFGAHPHRDMEIISYVMSGALEHKDSMGTKAVILPGEVQKMSAGSGITHSEYNQLPETDTHFFQIWIQPSVKGGAPSYGQKSFAEALNSQKQVLVISQDGREGSIAIKQDADLYISRLKAGEDLEFKVRAGRGTWIQVTRGEISINGNTLTTGDALSTNDEGLLRMKSTADTEIMLFDLK
jgi:quercetin 2,3-dioxygenase